MITRKDIISLWSNFGSSTSNWQYCVVIGGAGGGDGHPIPEFANFHADDYLFGLIER